MRQNISLPSVAGFLTGIFTMSAVQWHLNVAWVELYAKYPITGYSSEVIARATPGFMMSNLSMLAAVILLSVLAFMLALVFRGGVAQVSFSLAVGAWLVPIVVSVVDPETYAGQFGIMGLVIYSMMVAGMVGFSVALGAVPGACINWVTARFLRWREKRLKSTGNE